MTMALIMEMEESKESDGEESDAEKNGKEKSDSGLSNDEQVSTFMFFARSCCGGPVLQSVVYWTREQPGSIFTNHSQERSLSFSPRFVHLNVT